MTDPYGLSQYLEFATNPEPRCPCIMLLDTSGSMRKQGRIEALSHGIRAFRNSLLGNPLVTRRAEVAVITFSDQITLVQDSVTVDQFDPPTLRAREKTFMGEGLLASLNQLEQRKETFKKVEWRTINRGYS